MSYDDTPHEPTEPVEDDQLRLLFTCATRRSHPKRESRRTVSARARALRQRPWILRLQIAQPYLDQLGEGTAGRRAACAERSRSAG
jgi:RNA polymerase sigma-70 factor (ECF subfamily)